MGNCSFKETTGECHHSIRVLTDSGSVLQFKGPKTVSQVLQNHTGYGVFRQGNASSPLPEQENLSYGILYYLLPLKEAKNNRKTSCNDGVSEQELLRSDHAELKGENDERLKNSGRVAACDYVENLSNGSALEVLPSAKNGVWKVKLVIDTRQLEEILSEQVNTEALIEKMRIAATAYSTSSPTKSRIASTWKVGWKPTTFFNAFLAHVNSGKFTKSIVSATEGSN
ncbi:uncharacterized protein [Cicer arietinum]|uniref:Uncharacterized protein LOC101491152 n=1 Tax=Cicer arietinum TaxID=3827 RepID=A0A1S2YFL5_CICAR|nr:uncharacterized protein LOC101491152 [Cicer arietinum]